MYEKVREVNSLTFDKTKGKLGCKFLMQIFLHNRRENQLCKAKKLRLQTEY